MQTLKIERLAIIARHPVQYYAPVFQSMAKQHNIKVFYHQKTSSTKYDKGFRRNITWDIPLLEGYAYVFSHRIKDVQEYHPTVILVYGWNYLSHLTIIFHFSKKVQLLFRGDSTLLDETNRFRAMIKSYLLPKIFAQVNLALYVGRNNKAYFQRYGLKNEQLIYARHAVDNERFAANHLSEVAKLRSSLGIPDLDILILFAGKLTLKKNPQILLKAFGALNIPGLHLLVVGDGILEAALKNTALTLSNRHNIHFLPFQNQQCMPVIYQSCDLFCMPSAGPGETWGMAINEAMAAGKAILASDKVGGAADLIDHRNGRIFNSGDLKSFMNELEALLKCKDKLLEMGKTSSEKIKSWDFQHQIDAIHGIS